MFRSVEAIDRLSSAPLGFLKAPVSSFPSPVLHFQAPTPWRPITSSWGASTWSSFPKRSPRAPPTSSNDCAGSVPMIQVHGSVSPNITALCVFFFSGTTLQRGWAIRKMEWRTSRNTSTSANMPITSFYSECVHPQCSHGNMSLSFRWFEGFNWDGLCQGTIESPYTPTVCILQRLFNITAGRWGD